MKEEMPEEAVNRFSSSPPDSDPESSMDIMMMDVVVAQLGRNKINVDDARLMQEQ